MPDDQKFDDLIAREAKGYRAGAQPRADAMWARIERDVADAIQPRRSTARHWPWLAAGAGIAAALVIGVAIGRRSARLDPGAPRSALVATSVSADSLRSTLLQAATVSHLGEAEVFLTEVRADLRSGRADPLRGDRSRNLLARTRLIMAGDGAHAPAVERLLQDLELVLAEIAALPDSGSRRAVDARLLDERLRAGTVLPRIRTLVPPPSTTGGP